jgi:capsular exopolysaccharide synthesis family protein
MTRSAFQRKSSKLGITLLGVIPKSRGNNPAEELLDPKSSLSEAYNSLRGALMFSTASGMPKVMLVTSAQPSEGKTTTSMSLAAGLARMGKKTILIDADMRRPTLHRYIDDDNAEGLSTILPSTSSVLDVIHHTAHANMWAITSRPVPPSPTELISSNRMAKSLRNCRESLTLF